MYRHFVLRSLRKKKKQMNGNPKKKITKQKKITKKGSWVVARNTIFFWRGVCGGVDSLSRFR